MMMRIELSSFFLSWSVELCLLMIYLAAFDIILQCEPHPRITLTW